MLAFAAVTQQVDILPQVGRGLAVDAIEVLVDERLGVGVGVPAEFAEEPVVKLGEVAAEAVRDLR